MKKTLLSIVLIISITVNIIQYSGNNYYREHIESSGQLMIAAANKIAELKSIINGLENH